MVKVRFTGRIFPAAINISIDNHPATNWKSPDLGLDMTFRVQIKNNNITIECEMNRFDGASHVTPLFMRAHDIARATVDLISFSTGNGLVVILDTFTDPNGITTSLAAQQPTLAALATAINGEAGSYDKVLRILLTEPPLFIALRDLIDAITIPHSSPANCARAVEALRAYFVPSGGQPSDGWNKLRENLQISKAYLEVITDTSKGPRHGDHAHIPGSITSDVATRAWTVMNRFFEYQKRGAQPLPLSEFPML